MTQRLVSVSIACFVVSILMIACGGNGSSGDVVAEVADAEADICTPACAGLECGPNGCGGYCGSCQEGFSCSGAGVCKELPKCELVAEVACGETVSGDTTGRANELQAYECDDFMGTAGEIVYVFQAQIDDIVTVELTPQLADQEILVTQGPCAPDSCLARSIDTVEIGVDGGKKYYLVVDGLTGEEGPFSLTVSCKSTCQPLCGGKECGDDGCGGVCGTCPQAAPECVNGYCEGVCEPDCGDHLCGNDGCGGSCGECGPGENCLAGFCCATECDGLECGDDGCGGDCGPCAGGEACDDGVCVGGGDGCVESGTPGCGGCPCEACVCAMDDFCCNDSWDSLCVDECIDQCGGCEPVEGCGNGVCEAGEDEDCITCPADCACPDGGVCLEGTCCLPQCDGKDCGDDGCGGVCGSCGVGYCWEDACYDNGTHCLEVVPDSVDFGVVDVGAFKLGEALIVNCGTADLTITAIDLVPGGSPGIGVDVSSLPYAPTPDKPISLESGASQTLGVLYLPAEISAIVDGEPVPDMAEVGIVATEADLQVFLTVQGVAVDPDCPVAAFEVAEGTEIAPLTLLHLDGSASSSPGGDIEEYNWAVTAPDGILHDLDAADTVDPTFKASVAGIYLFTLEVKDGEGVASCVPAQVEVVATPTEALYVEMYWDTPGDPDGDLGDAGSDLDLHLAHPWATGPDIDGDGEPDPWFNSPYDCYWMNPEPDWGALNDPDDDPALLLDDSGGAGPEVFVLDVPEDKVYTVGVHYFSDMDIGPANAHVKAYIDGNLAFEHLDVELQEMDMWEVATVDWVTGQVTLVEAGDGGLKITADYVHPLFE